MSFDQSLINSAGLNYGLIDANIVTRRTDLVPFPSGLTYAFADFNSKVAPTTSVTSTVGPGIRSEVFKPGIHWHEASWGPEHQWGGSFGSRQTGFPPA